MSLLLEALKKAELAKQGKEAAEGDARAAEIEFEPSSSERAPLQPSQPVITRGQLPDISQPLEILSEDLPSSPEPPAQSEPQPAEAPRSEPPLRATREPQLEPEFEPSPRAPAEPAMDSVGAEDRDAARQLFEAKEVAYNPKRNFYITIGVLLSIGAGYAGWVWWQLQPKSTYNVAAVQNAPKGPPAAPVKPISTPPAPAPALDSTPTPAAESATPAPPPVAGPAKPAAAKPAPAADATAKAPAGPIFARSTGTPAAAQASARPPAGSPGMEREAPQREASPIAVKPPVRMVDPMVARGFDAYQRNDLAAARESYQQALRRDPLNRDALLGIAAIDVRERHFGSAQASYIRLLELDPRDVNAAAGLIALRGQVNPGQSESQLKTLIATSPDAAVLYFTLGNHYAQQSRWSEAQAAFFKAYAGEPENADFAVNLAISLDHLRKTPMALRYYHEAVALAANHPVSFDPNLIRKRIKELE